MQDIFRVASKLSNEATPFVVVTLLSARGHAPQDPGAKMVVTELGLVDGTVGGGKIEAKAILLAQESLRNEGLQKTGLGNDGTDSAPKIITWNLQTEVGMSCGGEVTLLFEIHNPQSWQIVLFGAGHVVQALARVLEPIHCNLHIIDPRWEWLDRLPKSSRIVQHQSDQPVRLVRKFNANCFFVVITQGHGTDLPVLQEIFAAFPEAPYIGVLGSDLKSKKIRKDLLESGVLAELVEKLHCPMGLPIGNNNPAEIAVSIVAELMQVRDQLSTQKSPGQKSVSI